MDTISVSEKSQNETQRVVTRSKTKRKHSESVVDNENIKKQKVDLQNEETKDNIKVENEELLQSKNDFSPENKEDTVRPTHSDLNESNIANLNDDDAFSLDKENELKPNLTITKIEQSKISCGKEETQDIAINTVCETVSESNTINQNSDDSSPTGIDNVCSGTSSVPDPEPIKREEAKTFRKLYRLLGESENKDNGLRAKNPRSYTGVAEHVAKGSNGGDSRYISTCSTRFAAQTLLRLKTKSRRYRNGNKKIVEIDVNNLPLNVDIIDLTEENLRKPYEVRNEDINRKFHSYAESYGEVLLVGYIPAYCLQYT